MAIYNLGSINQDRYLHLPRLPVEGDTLAVTSQSRDLGGKGFNISLAIHRAGGSVTHIGAVGEGSVAPMEMIRGLGLSTAQILPIQGVATGEALVLLEPDGGNSILLDPGANQTIPEAHIRTALNSAQPGDWLIMQNETNGQEVAIDAARRRGMKIALVAAPFEPEKLLPLVSKVDLVSANRVEFAQLQQSISNDPSRFEHLDFAITYGAERAEYLSGDKTWSVPSFRVQATNTTGAGDTFFGYLITALDQGHDPEYALGFANAAAALKVQRPGSASGIPKRTEVLQFMEARDEDHN